MRMLAILVLATFIYHILIFHPFSCSKTGKAYGPAPMYDCGSHAEFIDDQPDTTSLHFRRGTASPILSVDVSTVGDPLFLQLLLNAAAEHPPKV